MITAAAAVPSTSRRSQRKLEAVWQDSLSQLPTYHNLALKQLDPVVKGQLTSEKARPELKLIQGGGGGGGTLLADRPRWNWEMGGGNALYNLLANAWALTPYGRKFTPDPDYKGDGWCPPQAEPKSTVLDPDLPFGEAVEAARVRAIKNWFHSQRSRGLNPPSVLVYENGKPVELPAELFQQTAESKPAGLYLYTNDPIYDEVDEILSPGTGVYAAMDYHLMDDELERELQRCRLLRIPATKAGLYANWKEQGRVPSSLKPVLDPQKDWGTAQVKKPTADTPPWAEEDTLPRDSGAELVLSEEALEEYESWLYEDDDQYVKVLTWPEGVAWRIANGNIVDLAPGVRAMMDPDYPGEVCINSKLADTLYYRHRMSEHSLYQCLEDAAIGMGPSFYLWSDTGNVRCLKDSEALFEYLRLPNPFSPASAVGEAEDGCNELLEWSVNDLNKISNWIKGTENNRNISPEPELTEDELFLLHQELIAINMWQYARTGKAYTKQYKHSHASEQASVKVAVDDLGRYEWYWQYLMSKDEFRYRYKMACSGSRSDREDMSYELWVKARSPANWWGGFTHDVSKLLSTNGQPKERKESWLKKAAAWWNGEVTLFKGKEEASEEEEDPGLAPLSEVEQAICRAITEQMVKRVAETGSVHNDIGPGTRWSDYVKENNLTEEDLQFMDRLFGPGRIKAEKTMTGLLVPVPFSFGDIDYSKLRAD